MIAKIGGQGFIDMACGEFNAEIKLDLLQQVEESLLASLIGSSLWSSARILRGAT
jgi:hypothetical protein